MQNDRHVEAYRALHYLQDLVKNDELMLLKVSSYFSWGVMPIFSKG